ncbi:MAG: metallophosphoesterase [Candidatus Doudnabacteria bacterium]|nr:metallophosphoesterase [Candidatus Doudnabacteria bacterium]
MIIVGFLSFVQLTLFFGHFIVYKTFVKFFQITHPQNLLYTRLVFLLLSISFLVASALAYKFYGSFGRTAYASAAVWLGTLYWLVWASLFAWILYFLLPHSISLKLGQSLFILALLVSAYGVWNSYQTKVKHITITIPNLPSEWQGKKAVLVSDTHLGNVRSLNFSKRIAELVSAQNPDIVLVPGDFYDGPPANYEELAEPFGKIKSTYGVYFAAGNHEEFGDAGPLLSAIAKSGVKVLNNQIENVNGLQIIGVGYGATVNKTSEKSILDGLNINRDLPSILLKHAPTNIETAEAAGISLQVSGHTHLGQVYPFRYLTKKIYGKFHYGASALNNTQVVTTSGVGTWGPPQRVGTNSEIVVITFR